MTVTSAEMLAVLRVRYAPPEWYLVSEVENATGSAYGDGKMSRADAVAVRAWQSGRMHGQRVKNENHLLEIKRDRADFRRELKDPKKADTIGQFCHRRWIVVPAPWQDVVGDDLPRAWGLIEIKDRKSFVRQMAPLQDAIPASQRFLAALVRRACDDQLTKEGEKAAILKAPMQPVCFGESGSAGFVLACGHMFRARGGSVPPRWVRCLACANGDPPMLEVLHQALQKMTGAELRELAARALQQADEVALYSPWSPRKLGLGARDPIAAELRQIADKPVPCGDIPADLCAILEEDGFVERVQLACPELGGRLFEHFQITERGRTEIARRTVEPSLAKPVRRRPRQDRSFRQYYGLETACRAGREGECTWAECPQERDGEPQKTGRHCPLDVDQDQKPAAEVPS